MHSAHSLPGTSRLSSLPNIATPPRFHSARRTSASQHHSFSSKIHLLTDFFARCHIGRLYQSLNPARLGADSFLHQPKSDTSFMNTCCHMESMSSGKEQSYAVPLVLEPQATMKTAPKDRRQVIQGLTLYGRVA